MQKLTLAAALAVVAAGAAQAHVTLETGEAPAGTYKAVLRVPHGCEGEATLRLRVQIPEGVIAVKPMPKPGWELETVTGKYARSYDYYGTPLTEGVTEIDWTGKLPDACYDEFVFRGTLTDGFAPGTIVYFPVVQECAGQDRALDRDPGRRPGSRQRRDAGARGEDPAGEGRRRLRAVACAASCGRHPARSDPRCGRCLGACAARRDRPAGGAVVADGARRRHPHASASRWARSPPAGFRPVATRSRSPRRPRANACWCRCPPPPEPAPRC